MKSIAIMQPVYLPWLGYFEQIGVTDTFMFLDDVQYTKQDWRNRNRIRSSGGWFWLTVPVSQLRFDQPISETHIRDDYWKRKHICSLHHNYISAPFYNEILAIIEPHIYADDPKLITLTMGLIESLADYLSIGSTFLRASDVPRATTDRNARIIELCQHAGANCLYTGPAAKAYIDYDLFERNGVDLVFQDYQHPTYKQMFGGFESHMSIIDLLMNYGKAARDILLSSPLPPALSKKVSMSRKDGGEGGLSLDARPDRR